MGPSAHREEGSGKPRSFSTLRRITSLMHAVPLVACDKDNLAGRSTLQYRSGPRELLQRLSCASTLADVVSAVVQG